MLEPAEAQERCAAAIAFALKAGADAADAVAIGSSSEEVQVRLGKLGTSGARKARTSASGCSPAAARPRFTRPT
jgi:hypothetical protein